ncbi:AI-2E family transporter [Bacillus suaedaesalsae]|uniref:AI-2E family transporter n=1 Tax=Bacillus suaedaesalsae TaxID=2810349 RepID=A0ABS2DMF8_9BACI|nr:AI-2E family transporter [Bacillus suaedaesalsae]
MKKINIEWISRLVALLLLLLCIFIFIRLEPFWNPIYQALLAIIVPFILASFITYLLHPLVEKLHAQNIPRPLSILIIYVLFFGSLGLALYKGIPQILIQIKEFGNNVPAIFETYRGWTNMIDEQTSRLPEGLHERIEESLVSVEEGIASTLASAIDAIKGIINYILIIAIIPFIVFYMLKDYDMIKKSVWYMTPRRYRRSGIRFLKDIDQSLGSYIRGQLLVCFLIGIIATTGLWIIGMKYPLLLGTIIGITNIIPYFGPIIGAVPALLIAITVSGKMVLWVGILIFTLQFIEGNLLSPMIVGKSLHMHPVFIMFALIAGGEIGGVIGLIFAVPMLAILKVTIIHAKAHFTKQH